VSSLIRFSTNQSEWATLEGLIISEQTPPGFIAGAQRNVVCFVGETLRGPVDVAVDCNTAEDVIKTFGHRSRFGNSTLVNSVWLALQRKPFGKVVVVRTAAAAAVAATRNFLATATPIITVTASSVGAWGNDLTVEVIAATDANANHFNLRVNYRGGTTTYENLDVSAVGNNNISLVIPTTYETLITVTKLADGRPDNIGPTALSTTPGADGSVADTDYTAANRGLNVAASYAGVSVVTTADRCTTAVKSTISTLAAAAADRMFLMWNGSHTATVSAIQTDAALYRGDRVIYCENSPTILDPETASTVEVAPTSVMASILSQIDVMQHTSSMRTLKQTAGILSVHFNRSIQDLKDLKAAGVCSLEKQSVGFRFRSGVTTSITAGLTEIVRRRECDFLQLSAAERLQVYVYEEDTTDNTAAMIGELNSFCDGFKRLGTIIRAFSVEGLALDPQGNKVIRWRVQLIGHVKQLVLQTNIGTGVTIELTAAA
jgi:hypothetical protein